MLPTASKHIPRVFEDEDTTRRAIREMRIWSLFQDHENVSQLRGVSFQHYPLPAVPVSARCRTPDTKSQQADIDICRFDTSTSSPDTSLPYTAPAEVWQEREACAFDQLSRATQKPLSGEGSNGCQGRQQRDEGEGSLYANMSLQMLQDAGDTSVESIIQSGQPLRHAHVQFFAYQTARGLKYIHGFGIAHRALRPCNLVVRRNCDLWISDFSHASGVWNQPARPHPSATLLSPESCSPPPVDCQEYRRRRRGGTYTAVEEEMDSSRCSQKVDIWAFGCILAELITRRPLFNRRQAAYKLKDLVGFAGVPPLSEIRAYHLPAAEKYLLRLGGGVDIQSHEERVRRVAEQLRVRSDGNPNGYVLAEGEAEKGAEGGEEFLLLAADLILRCLSLDPSQRPSATEILSHPVFGSFRDTSDEPEGRPLTAEEKDAIDCGGGIFGREGGNPPTKKELFAELNRAAAIANTNCLAKGTSSGAEEAPILHQPLRVSSQNHTETSAAAGDQRSHPEPGLGARSVDWGDGEEEEMVLQTPPCSLRGSDEDRRELQQSSDDDEDARAE